MEAGTNDVVVLPTLLVLIAIAHADLGGPHPVADLLGQLLVLGPAAGFAVGAAGAWVMGKVDQRFHIRPEYQSLYGIGLVLGAFVTGEAGRRGRVPGRLRRRAGRHRLQPDPCATAS